MTGWRAEEEEFCVHVCRFPGLEEKGLLSTAAFGLEAEVTMAGLLPFFHTCLASGGVVVVGVLGTSFRLDRERWVRLGRGGEGEAGVGEGGVCECECTLTEKAVRGRLPCSYMLSVLLGRGLGLGRWGRQRKKEGEVSLSGVAGVLQLLELWFSLRRLLERHGLGLAEKLFRDGRMLSCGATLGDSAPLVSSVVE